MRVLKREFNGWTIVVFENPLKGARGYKPFSGIASKEIAPKKIKVFSCDAETFDEVERKLEKCCSSYKSF